MNAVQALYSILIFGLAVLFCYSAVWLVLASPALRLFTDSPGVRKVHQKITPRIGGVCIVVAFLLLLFYWHEFLLSVLPVLSPPLFNAVILATLGIVCVGFLDDITIFELSSKTKFVAEVLIAILLILVSGIRFDVIAFMGATVHMGWVSWPLTILWLVGVTNALNIIDGIDGLAGTVSLTAFTAIGILAYLAGESGIFLFCILCAGLVVGFLLHNFPPSRIFLGDTGSLFLGMLLGLLCVYLVSSARTSYPIVIAPLIVGFPILDVFLAMTRRFTRALLNGETFLKAVSCMLDADNEHIHHRLLFRGLNHWQTTLVISLYAGTTCAMAIVIGLIAGVSTILFLVYLGAITVWFVYKLGFFDRFSAGLASAAARYRSTSGPRRSCEQLAVFTTDVYMKHALTSFPQNVFKLYFIETDDTIDAQINFSALIVNSTETENQKEDLDRVIGLASRLRCPFVFLADEFAESSWQRVRGTGVQALFIRKPIYVPKFLNDVHLLIRNSGSILAFENVFSNKTSVWPVVGRQT